MPGANQLAELFKCKNERQCDYLKASLMTPPTPHPTPTAFIKLFVQLTHYINPERVETAQVKDHQIMLSKLVQQC